MKTSMLSPREKSCLRWVSQGRTLAEVALLEGKSETEIELYLERALVALEAKTIEDALEEASLFSAEISGVHYL